VRSSAVVEERRSRVPERRKPEAREKLARQVVMKPEIPAIDTISKEIPEEIPKRDVREPVKETPKPVAKEAPGEVVREVPKEMVALPRVAPKEAPKEVQKETAKEVAEQPAGEILKDAPKEAPKEIPQPIGKEVVKEAPKEIPKTSATEVTRGASKEVPKETPAVVVRDVVKEVPKEAPPEAARVILHPGVKLTTWAKEEKTEKTVALHPSLHAQEDEVKHFFESYVDRYRQKDAVGFLSCFSTQAVQNQTEGFDAIRSIYTKWIDQSEELRYQIEGMKIEIYQHRVDVKARFKVEQKLKKDGAEKVWKGSIRWVLVKEGGRLKIRSLDYQNERSR
jgi:ketosteroid isomerase-like protein